MYPSNSIQLRVANSGASLGCLAFPGMGMLFRSYRSQYFLGALNGKCGFRNPTAKKNGCSLLDISRKALTAAFATMPSIYASSDTSADSDAERFKPVPFKFFGSAYLVLGSRVLSYCGLIDQETGSWDGFPPPWKILPMLCVE